MDVGVKTVLADRYELGESLGRGGMAEVRAARDRRLERTVAVKIFNPVAWTTGEGRARFEAEARLAASVSHPNVVVVYDVGVDDGTPFLVMECLPGATFGDEIRGGRISVARVREIAGEVLDALAAAHARGVLHRDLKPANVLIAADGHSKLTDFGIATSETLTELTAAGMVIGTPAYLAPERIEGEPATVRSDLYSVGVMCYEALTGTRPFRGDSPIAVAYAARHSRPESVRHRRDDVPRELDAAVMRAIARRPEDRFGTAEDFAAALANQSIVSTDDATVPNMPVTATRVLPVHSQPDDAPRHNIGVPALAILAAAIVLLALGAFALRPHGSSAPASRTPVTAPRPLPPSLQLPFDTLQHLVQR